jgi:hypothetical protein
MTNSTTSPRVQYTVFKKNNGIIPSGLSHVTENSRCQRRKHDDIKAYVTPNLGSFCHSEIPAVLSKFRYCPSLGRGVIQFLEYSVRLF